MKKAFRLHASSSLKSFSWPRQSLKHRPNKFCRACEASGALPRAFSSDVSYEHKGSWYTPPGPKLPEGTEIDCLPPAEAIGYSTVEGPDIPRDELLCVVRKLMKKMKRAVLVGDRVRVVRVDWVDGRGMISEVLPRRSELLNPGVANIDQIVVLVAFADPPFDDYQVTRFLLAAEATGVPVTLVINKSDLLEEHECDQLLSRVSGWGYKPIALSVDEGTGIKEISRRLMKRWSVVVGPSGVGKSSLINYLRNRGRKRWSQYLPIRKSDLAYSTLEDKQILGKKTDQVESSPEDEVHKEFDDMTEAGDVDEWEEAVYGNRKDSEDNDELLSKMQSVQSVSGIGRGKHTTRTISFLDLPSGGLLADTPGFNLADLSAISLHDLPSLFPEIESRLLDSKCKFRDCNHISEPGCMVRGDWDRYPLYCDFFQEIRDWEFHEEKFLQSGKKKREGDVKVKNVKGGEEKEEAKLDSKKHRRVSRRSRVQKLYDMVNEEVWDDFEESDD